MKTLNLWESVYYEFRYRGRIENWISTVSDIGTKHFKIAKYPWLAIRKKDRKSSKIKFTQLSIYESEEECRSINERVRMIYAIKNFDFTGYENQAIKEIYDFITLSSLNGMGVQKWDY